MCLCFKNIEIFIRSVKQWFRYIEVRLYMQKTAVVRTEKIDYKQKEIGRGVRYK